MEKRSHNSREGVADPKQRLRNWIMRQVDDYASDYDLSNSWSHRYVYTDEIASSLFCEWMQKKELLNMKPYRFSLKNGETYAVGFEIAEDELLTVRLLELSN